MQGDYYHVYNRGVNRDNIFWKDQDYLYCLKRISDNCIRYCIKIIAYCLMPNHYHFLVRQDGEAAVSRWVQTIFNGYVQAANREFNRKGTLFEGRCQIKVVDKEDYLIYLVRYIHLNPVHAGLVLHAGDWPYSNYLEWAGERQGLLVDEAFIDEWFDSRDAYCEFLNEYKDIRQDRKIEKYLFDQ